MLKNQLYIINKLQHEDQQVVADIALNSDSEIFKGHFPDVAVLPGVSMMQMVKEILEEALDEQLKIDAAAQLKYLQMVNPLDRRELLFEIAYERVEEQYKVKAVLFFEAEIIFKMSARLS